MALHHRMRCSVPGLARAAIVTLVLARCAGGTGAGSTSLHAPTAPETVVRVTAHRFAFDPAVIHVHRGVPVALDLVSLDRVHGFLAPDLGLRTDVLPGQVTRVRFVASRTGTFPFHCDVFCGPGHEEMSGVVVVDP